MDINSLLSPSETPANETPPPQAQSPHTSSPSSHAASSPNRQHRPSHQNKRTSSALSQQVIMTSSPLRSPQEPLPTPLSHRDAGQNFQHYALPSPGITSAPGLNGRLGSHTNSPTPVDSRGSLTPMMRQGSEGMDALADLAALQQKQSPRTNARTQPLTLHNLSQNLSRSLSSQSANDLVMADRSPKLLRTFRSQSISSETAQALLQLSETLREKPLDHTTHVQYIGLLKQGLNAHLDSGRPAYTYELFDDLRHARQSMDATYTLGEDLWLEWLYDESLAANNTDDRQRLIELYAKCLQDEPTSSRLWRSWGDLMYEFWAAANQVPGAQTWAEEDRLIGREVFTWDAMSQVWHDGIEATQWHINGSQIVWDRCIEIFLQDQADQPTEIKQKTLENMFATRLMKPHFTWDQTFQLYSSFISKHFSQEYEVIMDTATKQASQAKKQYSMREPFEHQIQIAMQSGDKDKEWSAYKLYLDWELKHKGIFSFDLINGLYERATTRFGNDATLWEDYVEFLVINPNQAVSVLTVAERATRHCPWSGDLWSHRLLTLEAEQRAFVEMEQVKHKATESGMLDQGGMEELLKVYISWCGFLRRKAFENPNSTEDDADIAEMGIRSALEHVREIGQKKYGNQFQGDPMYRLERIHIKFFTQKNNMTAAREIWDSLIPQQEDSYDFWYRYYIWEMVMWSRFSSKDTPTTQLRPPFESTTLLRKALKRVATMDWPEQLIAMFLNHCEQHESVHELRTAIIETRRANMEIARRREKEAAEAAAAAATTQEQQPYQGYQQSHQDVSMNDAHAQAGKRKREFDTAAEGDQNAKKTKTEYEAETMPQNIKPDQPTDSAPLKRDRENTTVIVRNIPLDANEVNVRQFFRDTGVIISLKMLKEDHTQTGTIEFETPEEAEYAQTKSVKPFRGQQLEISIGTETTLWVTNYPADADEGYIRKLFERFGEIVGIRFPSLKYKSHRRFCYVQFLTKEQAKAATQLHGQKTDEEHNLVVKISNPSVKLAKASNATTEGREVIWKNISFDATGKDFQELAERFGELESARILRKVTGGHKGLGFAIYKTKAEAEFAVESMDGKPFMSRELEVKITDPDHKTKQGQRTIISATPEPQALKDDGGKPIMNYKARSIYLLGIPDTVNDIRIRSLAEKYGPVNKISMYHEHQGAVVEFKNLADQGKASLALDGYEISPGRFLRLGTYNELKQNKAEIKSDRLSFKPKPDTSTRKSTTLVPSRALQAKGARKAPKLGLGFKPVKPPVPGLRSEPKEGGTNGTAGAVPAGGAKSNADFKAMFLAGRKNEEGA